MWIVGQEEEQGAGLKEREFPCSISGCSPLVLPSSASGKAASGVGDKYWDFYSISRDTRIKMITKT